MKQSRSDIYSILAAVLASVLFISSYQICNAQLVPNLGGQRAGISAFQFLKIGVGARGVGLGETFVAIANDASALYWNPAGLTQFSENQIIFSHTEYVIDLKHEFIGAAYHLSPTDAIGCAITSLHTDPMEITTETQPRGTGRYFKFGDLAIGLSYSRKMTDQFSFGITVKYVEETLDVLKMRGTMVDLGTYYWTGLGTSRFAIAITNFGGDVSPSGTVIVYGGKKDTSFQSFSPPTMFKLGFAMEPYENETHRVTTSLELNHPNDNAENIHLGIEYQFGKWLRLRTGLKRTIGESFLRKDNTSASDYTLGIGVSAPLLTTKVDIDYAYANFNLLGSVHRISLSLSY
jgi:long-subunit fatty acid transport protein